MKKEYKIKTVQDMVDCTNKDNLDNFLIDLRILLENAHNLREKVKIFGEIIGVQQKISDIKYDGYTWIDDGEHNAEIIIWGKRHETIKHRMDKQRETFFK